jgi:hypothetical protein
MAPWRAESKIQLENNDCCNGKRMDRQGLMDHLSSKEKSCFLHFGIKYFLKLRYPNNNVGLQKKSITSSMSPVKYREMQRYKDARLNYIPCHRSISVEFTELSTNKETEDIGRHQKNDLITPKIATYDNDMVTVLEYDKKNPTTLSETIQDISKKAVSVPFYDKGPVNISATMEVTIDRKMNLPRKKKEIQNDSDDSRCQIVVEKKTTKSNIHFETGKNIVGTSASISFTYDEKYTFSSARLYVPTLIDAFKFVGYHQVASYIQSEQLFFSEDVEKLPCKLNNALSSKTVGFTPKIFKEGEVFYDRFSQFPTFCIMKSYDGKRYYCISIVQDKIFDANSITHAHVSETALNELSLQYCHSAFDKFYYAVRYIRNHHVSLSVLYSCLYVAAEDICDFDLKAQVKKWLKYAESSETEPPFISQKHLKTEFDSLFNDEKNLNFYSCKKYTDRNFKHFDVRSVRNVDIILFILETKVQDEYEVVLFSNRHFYYGYPAKKAATFLRDSGCEMTSNIQKTTNDTMLKKQNNSFYILQKGNTYIKH